MLMMWAAELASTSHIRTPARFRLIWEGTSLSLRTLSMTLRGLFLVMLILGIALWTGKADGVKYIHMGLGIVFVAVLWAIGVIGAMRAGKIGLQVGTFVLGLLLAIVGMTQEGVLKGSGHWIIQVVHLLLALLSVGFAEMIVAQVKRGAPASAPATNKGA